ncbi:MAG: hypothetical protein SFY32_05955 [Bacteroidota bacterium]|nr:hypothetical protein [Bacteroidota bacterium]
MKSFILITFLFVIALQINAQDQIVKTNGDEIFGKVIRVNTLDVVYKKKDNLEGPEYSELKANILFIKYENGSKDVFTTSTTPVVNNMSTLCDPIRRYNSVFLDLGGNGLIASLNYERKFYYSKNNFITGKLGYGPFYIYNIVNLTTTFNFGDGMNYFEGGGGFGVFSYNLFDPNNLNKFSYIYFTPTFGYRRQSGSGFMFRSYLTMYTNATPNYAYNSRTGNYDYSKLNSVNYLFFPFLGISLGYSF